MHIIDLTTWPRRRHFEVFQTYDYPHFNLTAPLDLTVFLAAIREAGLSFTPALVYLLARAANAQVEFRWRIRPGPQVVEHERVHPSMTVLGQDDLFSFCTIPYAPDYAAFARNAQAAVARAQSKMRLDDEPGQDDQLFLTAIPWVAFSSLAHPIQMHPLDSVPRLSWGKFVPENERWKMPLSVQVHHGLVDGLHVGRYFQQVQAWLDAPQEILPL